MCLLYKISRNSIICYLYLKFVDLAQIGLPVVFNCVINPVFITISLITSPYSPKKVSSTGSPTQVQHIGLRITKISSMHKEVKPIVNAQSASRCLLSVGNFLVPPAKWYPAVLWILSNRALRLHQPVDRNVNSALGSSFSTMNIL